MSGCSTTHHAAVPPPPPLEEESRETPRPATGGPASPQRAATCGTHLPRTARAATVAPPVEALLGDVLCPPGGPRPHGSVLDIDVEGLPRPSAPPRSRRVTVPAPDPIDDERAVRRARLLAVAVSGGGVLAVVGAVGLWIG